MDRADVLVAGAGAAGMVAALAAAARGAQVLLVERDAATPSNLAISGGLFSAAGTRWQRAAGVRDSAERYAADVREKTRDAVDPVLLAAVTGVSARVADFLADEVGLPIHLHHGTWPGHSAMRLHATPAESGAELSDLLRAAVRRHPRIAFQDGVAITRLTGNGAELTDGARRQVAAGAIVLATGGFGAEAALVERHCPNAARAVYVGSAASDGAALRLAEPFGAALACMDSYQGQPHVSPHLVDGVRPRFGAALPSLGAVLVNRRGERFVEETIGPSELTAHILAQPEGQAVEIWDAVAQAAALAGGPFRRAVELGAVALCKDVPALASRFRLPVQALARALAERATRPLATPYYAAEVTGALAHTQGGMRVDRHARVLRGDHDPIGHLFAAGGAACGISGHGAAGYVPGNGLAQSFGLGLLAGEAAAEPGRLSRSSR